MAVTRPLGTKLNYPYLQSTIKPVVIGVRVQPNFTKINYPYAQSSIHPNPGGLSVKAPLPLPGGGGTHTGGQFGFSF